MQDRQEKRREEACARAQRMEQEKADTDAMHLRLQQMGLTGDPTGPGLRPISHSRTHSDPFSTPPRRGAFSEPSGSTYASPLQRCLASPADHPMGIEFKDLADGELEYILHGAGSELGSPMVLDDPMGVPGADLFGYGVAAGFHAAPPPPVNANARGRTASSSSDESMTGLDRIKNWQTDRERGRAGMKGAIAQLQAMNAQLERENAQAPPSSWQKPRPPRKSDSTP